MPSQKRSSWPHCSSHPEDWSSTKHNLPTLTSQPTLTSVQNHCAHFHTQPRKSPPTHLEGPKEYLLYDGHRVALGWRWREDEAPRNNVNSGLIEGGTAKEISFWRGGSMEKDYHLLCGSFLKTILSQSPDATKPKPDLGGCRPRTTAEQ
jgi:hypothetical protein